MQVGGYIIKLLPLRGIDFQLPIRGEDRVDVIYEKCWV